MEYYRIKIKFKNEWVGIGWDPKNQVLWVGGFNRIIKHVTIISFQFFKMEEDKLLPKTGNKQKNRWRNYQAMSDLQFRKGLLKLGYRYAVLPCKSGIKKFT